MSIKTLSEIISFLEEQPEDTVISFGFGSGASYRGSFGDVGFTPLEDVTISYMLECARDMLNTEHTGYKGGNYTIDEHSSCYIAGTDQTGDEINDTLLSYWEAGL